MATLTAHPRTALLELLHAILRRANMQTCPRMGAKDAMASACCCHPRANPPVGGFEATSVPMLCPLKAAPSLASLCITKKRG